MIQANHFSDDSGCPQGGTTYGNGFAIGWQNVALMKPDAPEGTERKPPNGAFVEDIIRAAMDRLEYYQQSKFACDQNAKAIEHLQVALSHLEERTAARTARGTEGTHQV